MEEVANISDKLMIKVYDFEKDKEKARELGIEKIPAIAVLREKDSGIRFYGIPSGCEFASFIEAIKLVSNGQMGLSDKTLDFIKSLKKDVHIQVFVTPTCPYCPGAVILAHKLANALDKIRADMVEVYEFPHLGNKYHVYVVPRTVINETVYQEGVAPETPLIEKIKNAL